MMLSPRRCGATTFQASQRPARPKRAAGILAFSSTACADTPRGCCTMLDLDGQTNDPVLRAPGAADWSTPRRPIRLEWRRLSRLLPFRLERRRRDLASARRSQIGATSKRRGPRWPGRPRHRVSCCPACRAACSTRLTRCFFHLRHDPRAGRRASAGRPSENRC